MRKCTDRGDQMTRKEVDRLKDQVDKRLGSDGPNTLHYFIKNGTAEPCSDQDLRIKEYAEAHNIGLIVFPDVLKTNDEFYTEVNGYPCWTNEYTQGLKNKTATSR